MCLVLPDDWAVWYGVRKCPNEIDSQRLFGLRGVFRLQAGCTKRGGWGQKGGGGKLRCMDERQTGWRR